MDQLLNISFWMWCWGWGAQTTRNWFDGFPRKRVDSDTHTEKR